MRSIKITARIIWAATASRFGRERWGFLIEMLDTAESVIGKMAMFVLWTIVWALDIALLPISYLAAIIVGIVSIFSNEFAVEVLDELNEALDRCVDAFEEGMGS